MHFAALMFSAFAALLVWISSRRPGAAGPRLAGTALVLLLAFPLFRYLPALPVLAPPASSGAEVPEAVPAILHTLWFAVSLVLIVRLVLSTVLLARWKRRSTGVGMVEEAGHNVELRVLPELHSPVAAGILKPVVYLPSGWEDWSEEARDMALAHELAHHRRRDPLWRTLGALACAIYWFNPLVWWLARRHSVESEFACDALVVSAGASPRRYAALLCDLAGPGKMPQAAVAISTKSGLRARVERLMKPPGSISAGLSTALLVTAVLGALGFSTFCRLLPADAPVPADEIRLRLSADPFPGN